MIEPDNTSLWERVKAAYHEALELEGDARETYLRQTARDDPALADELRSLLAQDDDPGGFLGDPTIPPEKLLDTVRPADDPVPERVGRYVVLRRLGAGGMGQVLLAHDPQLDRDVALKLLPEAFARDPARRERFLREARAAARLSHPHVAALHEVGEADGRDYLAFEYVDGVSLRQRIAEGALDLGELLAIAIPLARALEAAHDESVVHRDVKAGNVVLDRTGRPKLVDFGLAKQTLEDGRTPAHDSLTAHGRVVGTPGAMSPEQALGHAVDHHTDVFSFGSLLYAMAAGAEPFAGDTATATLSAVIHLEPEPLSERCPELPASLVALIDQMMEKDLDRRPGTMQEVADELERIRREPGVPGQRNSSMPGRALGVWLLVALGLALAWRFVVPPSLTTAERQARAAEELARAVASDPAFALAHFRQAMALIWTGDEDATALALERARAFRDKLPPDLRLLLDATVPYFRDDTTAALGPLLRVLEGDPSHKDALFMVGEIYTHSATRNDAGAAAAIYGRLLDLDPGFSVVYGHALAARLRQGDVAGAHELLGEWELRAPGAWREHEAALALWEGRLEDAAVCFAADPGTRNGGDREALLVVALLEDDHEAPRLSTVLDADVSRIVADLGVVQGLYRVLALDLRANVLALHGRFAEAAELYRRAADVPGDTSSDGFLTNARSGARHRLARLFVLRGDLASARREVDATLAVQPQSSRCLLESVRLALAEDDATRAADDLARLAAVSAENWSPATPHVLELALAETALADGRVAEARAAFEALLASGALMLDWGAHEDSIAPLVRSGLARACLAAGDPSAAAAAWDGLLAADLERVRHPIPWLTALGERARLAHAAGEAQRAAAFASRFLAHCGHAEPVPPLVLEVRALEL